jgi:hypothetical protein
MPEPLQCPACAAPFSPDDLRDVQSVLVCRHCGGMFDPQRLLGQPRLTRAARRPMPSHLEVERRGDTLTVSWAWWSPLYILLGVFALAWDAFLVVWYSLAFQAIDDLGAVVSVMFLFPLLHVAVGAGLTYLTIASFFNRTQIVAARHRELSVTHGPFPWYPQPRLPASEVSQLYVLRQEHRSENSTSVSYELRALGRNDKSLLLLRGLADPDVARWLEQEIEETLGIVDSPVAGQLRD